MALVAILVASSGCVSVLSGGTTTFESSPATVSDATLQETGYTAETNETETLEENVTVLGRERTVRVVNHVSVYDKEVSLGTFGEIEGARFAVITTPDATALGQSLNPLADLSERELVDRFSGRYGGVSNVSHVNNRTVQSLGESRDVEKFTGTVERAGIPFQVAVHVTKFQHDGDWVVAAAVAGQRLDEQGNVDELLRSLHH